MPTPTPHWRPWTLILTLVVGLGGSAAAGWFGYRAESERRRQHLEGEIQLQAERLQSALEGQVFLLEAMATHFHDHVPKNDADYAAYLNGFDSIQHYPGLRGINLGWVLSPTEVPAQERIAREDRSLLPQGHPDFRLHPARPADATGAVFMVRFVHPMDTNADALGFDSASRPGQSEALVRALRTDALVVTGPVLAAQDPHGPPTMIFRKLLRNPKTGAPWGYLNLLWQPQAALRLFHPPENAFDLQLVDLGIVGALDKPQAYIGSDFPMDRYSRQHRLEFGGRVLELRLRPKANAIGFGPLWWPYALSITLAALTLLAAYRHWSLKTLAGRIQNELEGAELQLRTVLSHFPDLLIILDQHLAYRDIFTGKPELLMQPRSTLLGRPVEETLPQPLASQVGDASRALLQNGGASVLEYSLDLPIGTRSFEARGVRLEGTVAEPRGVAWTIRDISARKEAELHLLRREEEFRQFFESAPSPLLISRLKDGKALLANAALRQMMEFPIDAPLDAITQDYYADPSQRQIILTKIMQEGRVRGTELSVRTRTGALRTVLLSSDLFHLEGQPVLISAFHDLTDQLRSEEALRQAQKLESLGLMASGIAHDFNNLLAAIQGNLDLAALGQDRPSTEKYLDGASAALQRAADLTRKLLAYSGKSPMQTGVVHLSQLAVDMASLLRVSIPKRIALDLNVPDDLPPVQGDRTQLQQVILNLVTNAADAIGDAAGMITLRAGTLDIKPGWISPPAQSVMDAAPGPHLWVSIADNGTGMNDDVKARIFDPFFTTKAQGRGLGLSAIQGILRAHHAGLHIESALGKGSTFTLYFPIHDWSHEAPSPAAPAHLPTQFQGRALVVDDEEALREASAAVLGVLGFEASTAQDGPSALAWLEAHPAPLDLLLLDFTMPLMDGLEVLARLRTTHPRLPVLLCSGYAHTPPQGLEADPHTRFLAKPFTLQELRVAIAGLLPQQG